MRPSEVFVPKLGRGDRPRVERHETSLRVYFPADKQGEVGREGGPVPGGVGEAITHADFHYQWLRHFCDSARHPLTGERTLCSSELPEGLRARDAWILPETQVLEVVWEGPDAHISRYGLSWLKHHAYAINLAGVEPPPSDLGPVSLVWNEADPIGSAQQALARVETFGLARVLGAGLDTERLIETFAQRGLFVRGTHFGRIEDLRTDNTTNQNTDQLGYTQSEVQLHTDQPFIETPPRYQLLHSMRAATFGGESFLVDGLQAARYLAWLDADAYQRLSTIPVHFHRRQKRFESLQVRTILPSSLEPTAEHPFQIRYSYFTIDPQRLPFPDMEAWYRAYNRFAKLVRNPAHQYRFVLEPGDFVLYDNFRMLHARTGFSGPRWVRGVYFDQNRL